MPKGRFELFLKLSLISYIAEMFQFQMGLLYYSHHNKMNFGKKICFACPRCDCWIGRNRKSGMLEKFQNKGILGTTLSIVTAVQLYELY